MAWVRNIQFFSIGYTIAIGAIIFTAIVISSYSIKGLIEEGPKNNGFQPVNSGKMFDMIGFSFYAFEGIGTVMPIMKEMENKD